MSFLSLRKQPTSRDATSSFPTKKRLTNERRNYIPMTRRFSDLGCASDWFKQISRAARPVRSTTQIRRHQYGISALVSPKRGNQWCRCQMSAWFLRLQCYRYHLNQFWWCSFRASTKIPRIAVWLVSGLSYLIALSFLKVLQNKELKMFTFN